MFAGQLESLSILEVSVPVRGERVSVRLHLNVSLDGSLGGINQPRHQRRAGVRVGGLGRQLAGDCAGPAAGAVG